MQSTPEYQRTIPGYSIILPLTMENLSYARIVLLVRDGLTVKLLSEHMENDLAAIWVKIGQQGRKPLVVWGVYREQHLLQLNAPRGSTNLTGTPNMQLDRWKRIVRGWKAATKDMRSVVIGDLNLD